MTDPDAFRFGRFRLLTARRELLADDRPVELGGRAFDVLLTLVRRHGELITKDELMDAVWPGVAVEENTLAVQIANIRRALSEGDPEARYILTIKGRGYRLTAPVEAEERRAGQTGRTTIAKTNASRARGPGVRPRIWIAVGAVAALVALGAGAARWTSAQRAHAPAPWSADDPRQSFAIIPVEPPEGDRALRAYADSFATALAATMTASSDGERLVAPPPPSADPRRGPHFLIGLRFGRSNDRGLVSLFLNDAVTHEVLMAGALAEPLAGPLDPQRAEIMRYSNAMKDIEARRERAWSEAKPAAERDARDLLLMGWMAEFTEAGANRAVQLAEAARRMAPDEPHVLSTLSGLLAVRVGNGWSGDPTSDQTRSLAYADQVLRGDPNNIAALHAVETIYAAEGRWVDVLSIADRLLALNPNQYWPLYNQALALAVLGRDREAGVSLERLIDLHGPDGDYIYFMVVGMVRFGQGHYAESATWLRKSVRAAPGEDLSRPSLAGLRLYLVSAEALQGRLDAAHSELHDFNAALPRVSGIAAFRRFNDPNLFPLVAEDRLVKGLHKAGMAS